MSVDCAMQQLGNYLGVTWYWAAPGKFEEPGLYYWDAVRGKNVRVDLTKFLPKD